jgi:hypothetical protein
MSSYPEQAGYDAERRWVVPPCPPHSRMFADFTGAGAKIEAGLQDALAYARGDLSRGRVAIPTPDNDNGPPAIGLSGFAGTGKTAAANYIESRYGYERRHIAEPLRAMLRTLLREYDYSDELIDRYLTGDLKEEVIPELGVTSRHCQITLGTEWGREQIDQSLWAKLWAFQGRSRGKVMNDSVRFPNEETAIREELAGFTIMIVRPGTGPVAFKWKRLGPLLFKWFGLYWGVHDSERIDRLDSDYVINNRGTLEDLYAEIDEIMGYEILSTTSKA